MPFHKRVTLQQFIAETERQAPEATGEFSQLLREIILAVKYIHYETSRAGINQILGRTGSRNVQGEEVQKLDVFAHEQLVRSLQLSGLAAVLGSEEADDYEVVNPAGRYVVLFDPLDGSSNIDVSMPVGTIFSIYRRLDPDRPITEADVLQPGRRQLAAGYVLYGTSTLLVYTTGHGVNGFTLEPTVGEFFLTHPQLQTPEQARYLSINAAARSQFPEAVRAYLDEVDARHAENPDALKPRYVGALVADFHRNLLEGGIFLYPGTVAKPAGKLRLLYEANPLAWIIEQAGGLATDGQQPILDRQPQKLHERTPLVLGSKAEVERFLYFSARELHNMPY